MKHRRSHWAASLAAAAALLTAATASADIVSDQAAALVVYPRVISDPETTQETLIQLTNTSTLPQAAHCFYIDSTSRCSLDNDPCDALEDPCAPEQGLCLPNWIETDFDVVITPRQPLAWVASQGLAGDELPLDGLRFFGIGNSSNIGTRIPPVTQPFVGELKCIATDGTGRPVPNNALIGHATVVITTDGNAVEKHSAIGILAIDGDANGDNVLVLGGGENEYNGCPQVLIVNHFFDFAVPTPDVGEVVSRLVLVPCTQDMQLAIPGRTTAQYLVFNEFEQRFSTSAPVECYFDRQLSLIDTRDETRSIFSAFVAGTISGQTRVRGVSQGLLGVLATFSDGGVVASNLHFQGDREAPDLWVLP